MMNKNDQNHPIYTVLIPTHTNQQYNIYLQHMDEILLLRMEKDLNFFWIKYYVLYFNIIAEKYYIINIIFSCHTYTTHYPFNFSKLRNENIKKNIRMRIFFNFITYSGDRR